MNGMSGSPTSFLLGPPCHPPLERTFFWTNQGRAPNNGYITPSLGYQTHLTEAPYPAPRSFLRLLSPGAYLESATYLELFQPSLPPFFYHPVHSHGASYPPTPSPLTPPRRVLRIPGFEAGLCLPHFFWPIETPPLFTGSQGKRSLYTFLPLQCPHERKCPLTQFRQQLGSIYFGARFSLFLECFRGKRPICLPPSIALSRRYQPTSSSAASR